jgi:hypothetical protein
MKYFSDFMNRELVVKNMLRKSQLAKVKLITLVITGCLKTKSN